MSTENGEWDEAPFFPDWPRVKHADGTTSDIVNGSRTTILDENDEPVAYEFPSGTPVFDSEGKIVYYKPFEYDPNHEHAHVHVALKAEEFQPDSVEDGPTGITPGGVSFIPGEPVVPQKKRWFKRKGRK